MTVAVAGLFAYKVLPRLIDFKGPRVVELFPHHPIEKGFLIFTQIMLGLPLYFKLRERFNPPPQQPPAAERPDPTLAQSATETPSGAEPLASPQQTSASTEENKEELVQLNETRTVSSLAPSSVTDPSSSKAVFQQPTVTAEKKEGPSSAREPDPNPVKLDETTVVTLQQPLKRMLFTDEIKQMLTKFPQTYHRGVRDVLEALKEEYERVLKEEDPKKAPPQPLAEKRIQTEGGKTISLNLIIILALLQAGVFHAFRFGNRYPNTFVKFFPDQPETGNKTLDEMLLPNSTGWSSEEWFTKENAEKNYYDQYQTLREKGIVKD